MIFTKPSKGIDIPWNGRSFLARFFFGEGGGGEGGEGIVTDVCPARAKELRCRPTVDGLSVQAVVGGSFIDLSSPNRAACTRDLTPSAPILYRRLYVSTPVDWPQPPTPAPTRGRTPRHWT